jgi:hypothetical protein
MCVSDLAFKLGSRYLNFGIVAVLALIEAPTEQIGFIVMEEWSPQLFAEIPTPQQFLGCLRQCVEVSLWPRPASSSHKYMHFIPSTVCSCIVITSPTLIYPWVIY